MRRIRKIAKLLLFTMVFLPLVGFAAKKNDGNSFSLQQYGMTVEQVKQSAAQGSPDAEYALGYMYYYGKGLPRDEESARMWIGKAAAQGQPQAIKALQLLKQPGQGQVTGTQTSATTTLSSTPKTQAVVTDTQSNTATTSNTDTTAGASSQNDASNADVAPSGAVASEQNNAAVSNTKSPGAAAAAPVSIKHGKLSHQAKNKEGTEQHPSKAKTISQVATSGALTEQKLAHAPQHYYTIQLLGSYDKRDVVAFINRNKLQNKATYYRTTFNGKPWFVVVYGLYPTEKQAAASLKDLAPQLDKANPWVKSLALVQSSMKK